MVYKILTIDGGGVLGTFPASFLATVETSLQRSVDDTSIRLVDYFDLVVGTSTGGIIALGLGLGFSCSEVLKFYQQYGPNIFCESGLRSSFRNFPFVKKLVADLWREKYDQKALKQALEQTFGTKRLGNSRVRLVIPSMNPDRGVVQMFKTAHNIRFERDYLQTAVSVALATSAAPSYFPAYVSERGVPYIDGGMCANNPIAVAVIEAIAVLDWPRDQLQVLSLGCTSTPLDSAAGSSQRKKLGELYWAEQLVNVVMAGQSTTALGQAELLIGKNNITRINPTMPPGRFALDSVNEIQKLVGLGDNIAREALPDLRKSFLNERAEPFEPLRKLSALNPDD